MKKFKVGDQFQGINYVDMINVTLGTTYKFYIKAAVSLKGYDVGGIAWFVYMNGSDNFEFRNTISNDGNTITEIIDDANKKNSGIERIYRLAFMRDPDNNGNKYKCKFVGYFMRNNISADKLIRTYVKVADTIDL